LNTVPYDAAFDNIGLPDETYIRINWTL